MSFRLHVIVNCLVFALGILLFPHPILAVQDNLANARDQINNAYFNWRAEHAISFSLPSNSYPIVNTDYIIIYLQAFTDITPPSLVSGDYAGNPIFSLSGQYAKVTNISVQPGGHIQIDGITAINPPDDSFQVQILISEDEAGTRVKNHQTLFASINSADVSVTATLPFSLANLRIMGLTAPSTFVLFSEAEAVMGTDFSNPLGAFNHLFTGLQPATHQITLYGIDEENRITSPVPLQIYTAASQETLVSNLLLSPTLQLNSSQYILGDPITASGSAIPDGLITIFVDTPLRTYYTTASTAGKWAYTITNSNEYVYGDYRIYALAQTDTGRQSLVSNSISFSIISGSGTTGVACGDISQGDLNCDGDIDLADFSILMYYWGTPNAAADINADGRVSLSDFSIMMYWWGS